MDVENETVTVNHNNLKLVLASASIRRLELLRQIGVEPDYIYVTNVDETPKYREHPRFLAKRLARNKAYEAYLHVSRLEEYSNSLFLAADTVVSVGRLLLPKPTNVTEAMECIKLLSGRTHKVYTALAMINQKGKCFFKVSENRVRFARLKPHEMEAYVKSYEWQDKAGGYAIQGLASSFIVRIVGTQSGVMGLPLHSTVELLESHGYKLMGNWQSNGF